MEQVGDAEAEHLQRLSQVTNSGSSVLLIPDS